MQRQLVEICQLGHVRLGNATANGGSISGFGLMLVGRVRSHGWEITSDVIARVVSAEVVFVELLYKLWWSREGSRDKMSML